MKLLYKSSRIYDLVIEVGSLYSGEEIKKGVRNSLCCDLDRIQTIASICFNNHPYKPLYIGFLSIQ